MRAQKMGPRFVFLCVCAFEAALSAGLLAFVMQVATP